MSDVLDYTVFIKVPLDVSMARRVRREIKGGKPSDYSWLLSELDNWESGARSFYLKWERIISEGCELIVDSMHKPMDIVAEIIRSCNFSLAGITKKYA